MALFTPASGEPYKVGGTVLDDGTVLLDNSYDPIPFDACTMKEEPAPSQEANAGHCWEWHQAPDWEVQCHHCGWNGTELEVIQAGPMHELCPNCETLLQP